MEHQSANAQYVDGGAGPAWRTHKDRRRSPPGRGSVGTIEVAEGRKLDSEPLYHSSHTFVSPAVRCMHSSPARTPGEINGVGVCRAHERRSGRTDQPRRRASEPRCASRRSCDKAHLNDDVSRACLVPSIDRRIRPTPYLHSPTENTVRSHSKSATN